MPFEFHTTDLPGLTLIRPRCFTDERGFFMETYQRSAFRDAGIIDDFVQVNHSRSIRGVLRGMHWQAEPRAQAKLIRVLRGCIYDVVIDLRSEPLVSPRWKGFELSADNGAMLYVPAGYAHGFMVISEVADVEYKVSAEYSPAHERGIRWDDPDIAIRWPDGSPILSEKDRCLPCWSGVKAPGNGACQ